ncbi:MAG: hypothetical protein LC768_14280, partial [Acidobacteria bacterium]|nr:hypothetical protein [Acidobacteriota bacterium]
KENEDFIANCLKSGWCEMVYEDDEAKILQIRDEKVEPPSDSAEEAATNDNQNANEAESEEN